MKISDKASEGAVFPAETQRRGDFLAADDTDFHGWGTTNHTKLHERGETGQRLAGQAGASESDSLASKLADAPVSESLTRSASGPASALRADVAGIGSAGGNQLDDSKEFLEDQSQAGLQMVSQKLRSIRSANGSGAWGEHSSSVPIREIRGQNSGSLGDGRSTLDTEASAKPIVFGCYGAARWEKGSDIFQEAIQLILKNEVASAECRVSSVRNQSVAGAKALDSGRLSLDSLRFCIQWVQDFQDEKGDWVRLDPWLKEHPQVEVVRRYFEGDEYERQLAATDVMVLPYRSPYRLRVSRVVIEAMMHGMPVIATQGTTLFEQAKEYGVVIGCEDSDAESLAVAMLEAAEGGEFMREKAKEKAKTVAKSFSVEYFRELLGKSG